MNLYDQLSQSLPVPNDTWTKTDILLYKLILTVASSVTDLNKEATQLLVKTAVDGVTAKLIVAPSTEAKQDALKTAIDLITAKLIVAPSTEAKQDALKTAIDLITAKLIVAPATEAKQDVLNAKDFATGGKQDIGNVQLGLISARLYQQVGQEIVGFAEGINTDVAADVIAAQGAGYYTYITSVLVINYHATVGTLIRIIDGTTAIMYKGYAAPVGGGFTISFPTPIRTSVANTKVQILCGTTGANIVCSFAGFKAP